MWTFLTPGGRGLVAALALVLSMTPLAPLSAQTVLHREATVQPVAAVEKGEYLVGLGFGHARDVRFTLLDLQGDLTRFFILDLAYAPADGVLLMFRGDALQTLFVDRVGEPPIEPDDGLADGKSTGATGLRVGALFRMLGNPRGFAGGLRLGFKIPNGNQREGLDTNSSEIRMSGLISYGDESFRLTADGGLAILEAPLESFEQNDVFVYSAEALWSPSFQVPLRVFLGVDGRASTRGRVPVGTEDLGEVRFGVDYRVGPIRLDAGAVIGFTEVSPDWGMSGGVALASHL